MCLHTSFNSINLNHNEMEHLSKIYSAIQNNHTDQVISLTNELINNDPNNAYNDILQEYISTLK